MNTGQTIGAIVVAVFTVIATVVGATWIVLEEIGEVRIELHKENAEVRENIGGLRGDVGNVDTKLGAFIDSHRRT